MKWPRTKRTWLTSAFGRRGTALSQRFNSYVFRLSRLSQHTQSSLLTWIHRIAGSVSREFAAKISQSICAVNTQA